MDAHFDPTCIPAMLAALMQEKHLPVLYRTHLFLTLEKMQFSEKFKETIDDIIDNIVKKGDPAEFNPVHNCRACLLMFLDVPPEIKNTDDMSALPPIWVKDGVLEDDAKNLKATIKKLILPIN